MPRIFISYRHADTPHPAGRIYNRLIKAFGRRNVFKDFNNIPPGRNFRGVIKEAVASSDVMLVLIGRQWLTMQDDQGLRRLDNPQDFVRIEVETGLERESCRVIPVLVDGATLPKPSDLPEGMRELTFNQKFDLRNDPDFDNDLERLVTELRPARFYRWIVAITSIAIALIMVLAFMLFSNNQDEANETPTSVSESLLLTEPPEVTVTREVTQELSPTPTASSTSTLTPSETPIPTLIFTPFPSNLPGGRPAISNAQWDPISQKFDGVEMVLVPIGCFMMGSNDGGEDELPVHEQCFQEPFWIDKYEVTNAQFESLDGVSSTTSGRSDPQRPRESINWYEASMFCEKRNARLPSEREWEYAARGPDGLTYPWGNSFVVNNVVNAENSSSVTALVGTKSGGASWVGALDLSGNVLEWTSDLYKAYPYDVRNSDSNSGNNHTRVLRGGSWADYENFLRASRRNTHNPDLELNYIGFRCVHNWQE
jgi:formylglycine-generating enzyme required for sulfatase activity